MDYRGFKRVSVLLMILSGALVIGCIGAGIYYGGLWLAYYAAVAVINSFTFYGAYNMYGTASRSEKIERELSKLRHPSVPQAWAEAVSSQVYEPEVKKNPVGFIW